MEFNFLVFRNPKRQTPSSNFLSRVRWIPCTPEEFFNPIKGTPSMLKMTSKVPNPEQSSSNKQENNKARESMDRTPIIDSGQRQHHRDSRREAPIRHNVDRDNKQSWAVNRPAQQPLSSPTKDRLTSGQDDSFNVNSVLKKDSSNIGQVLTALPVSLQSMGFYQQFNKNQDAKAYAHENEDKRFIRNPHKSYVTIEGHQDRSGGTAYGSTSTRVDLMYKPAEAEPLFKRVFETESNVVKDQLYSTLARQCIGMRDRAKSPNVMATPLMRKQEAVVKKRVASIPRISFAEQRGSSIGSTGNFLMVGSGSRQSNASSFSNLHVNNSLSRQIAMTGDLKERVKKTAPKYPLSSKVYTVVTNSKEYLLQRQQVHQKRSKGPPANYPRFPCLFLTPKETRNKTHLIIYFHANGEDLITSTVFLQHLSDSLFTCLVAPEYPGYSVYENQTSNEQIISENTETLVSFLVEGLQFDTQNVIVIGGVTRSIAGVLFRPQNSKAVSLPLSHFDISVLLPGSFGANDVWQSGEDVREGLLQERFDGEGSHVPHTDRARAERRLREEGRL